MFCPTITLLISNITFFCMSNCRFYMDGQQFLFKYVEYIACGSTKQPKLAIGFLESV